LPPKHENFFVLRVQRSSSLGGNKFAVKHCHFKYTPVKAKIKLDNYQLVFVFFLQQSKSHCHATNILSVTVDGSSRATMINFYIQLRGLSPRVNCTGQATAACLRSLANRGCHVVSMTDPYGHILSF
jgi:hypothetical protein